MLSEAARALAGRRQVVKTTCAICGTKISGTRKLRYCSAACRQRAYNLRQRERDKVATDVDRPHTVAPDGVGAPDTHLSPADSHDRIGGGRHPRASEYAQTLDPRSNPLHELRKSAGLTLLQSQQVLEEMGVTLDFTLISKLERRPLHYFAGRPHYLIPLLRAYGLTPSDIQYQTLLILSGNAPEVPEADIESIANLAAALNDEQLNPPVPLTRRDEQAIHDSIKDLRRNMPQLRERDLSS